MFSQDGVAIRTTSYSTPPRKEKGKGRLLRKTVAEQTNLRGNNST
jgi:hypothetical protein